MNNNCLVTKLKGVVDNDNLKYFDIIVLDIQDPAIQYQSENVTYGISLKFDSNSTIYIDGDGYFTDATQSTNLGKTLNIASNIVTSVYFSAGTNYKCIVTNKYNLLEIGNISGQSTYYKAYGFSISDLMYCDKLKIINVLSCPRVVGDISNLKTCLNLTNLLTTAGNPSMPPSGLYGKIDELFQKWAEDGRITSKIDINFSYGGSVTYSGGGSLYPPTLAEFISTTQFKIYEEKFTDTWTKTDGVWTCSTERLNN